MGRMNDVIKNCKGQRSLGNPVGSDYPTLLGRIIRRYTQEKVNGSKTASSLGGPPGHLKLAGVQRDHRHIEEHLQANPSA